MNHGRHYTALMDRAKNRILTVYSERHHILPKCLGGDNSPGNIVSLTPEEHYVAHQLLVFMYPGNHKILWAASNMTGRTKNVKRSNKLYGWLRRRLAEDTRKRSLGRKHTPEARAKMTATRTGLKRGPHSAEHRAKLSAAHKGRKKSPEHLAAIARTKTGKKRGPQSVEHRARLSASIKAAVKDLDRSWMKTPEYQAAQRAKMQEIWAKRKARALST